MLAAATAYNELMDGADYAGVFVRESARSTAPDRLVLPAWGEAEWQKLLASTVVTPFRTSAVVIQRGASDRALYLVADGVLEVGVTTFDGVSVASLAHIGAASVVGEQSFFDGEPRSANVWAVTDGALLRLGYDEFDRFGAEQPALARDFLFAVARVLSTRLRLTTIRVRR